jgi:hypothetical protein
MNTETISRRFSEMSADYWLESGDLVIGRSGDRKSEEAATKILRKTRNQLLATQMRADYSSGK